ncbi:MAG: DHHW family protein [Bacillota bacterium]|nr:DHHW family protein [Bacillota bacterium]
MEKTKNIAAVAFCAILLLGAVLFFLLPKEDYSQEERRLLATAPKLSLNSLFTGAFSKESETYLADHFPGRKFFVGLYNYTRTYTGRNGENGVYKAKDNHLFSAPASPERLSGNLKAIGDFSNKTDIRTNIMVVPTAGSILSENLPKLHLNYNDEAILNTVKSSLAPSVNYVDVYSLFQNNSQKADIYFKTDHHWTSYGAYLGYSEYAKAHGWEPLPESTFVKKSYKGFYGTNYAKSGLWLTPSDTLTLWEPPDPVEVEIKNDDKARTQQHNSPFFPEVFSGPDPYNIYFDGNHSLVRIINENARSGKLLIIKDSYANALAPFLSQHYREVDMIDLRYFRQEQVSEFISQNDITEILFLYSLPQLCQDTNFLWLK